MPAEDLLLCSNDDVINFCFGGDRAEAKKLANVGTWDDALLLDARKAGSSDVEAACGNKFTLAYSTDVTTYPFHLRKTAALRSGYYFWLFKARGKACPEHLKREVTDPDLQVLRDGKGGAGTQKPPTSRVTSVLPDVTVNGTVARMSLDGFAKW